MVRKIVLSLIAVFVFLAYATAQNRQISGTVSDANGHPVAGATVIVDGTSLGTTTNTAGEYTLSAPANGTLVVTFVGFEPQQLPIAGKTRINVTMKEDAQAIDDVIVVAFGTAKKEAFTGSAAVIKSDEIAKVQTSNVATALIGRVAGVQTSSTSGDLGKTPSIRVRGFGSINAGKEPLWIVDGMPYEGDLNNLNTNDIESMTVLKDAASNALYGARGANGVIMVTTKKAKSGDAVVTIDAKWGVNSKALEEYDVITSPAQYYETHFKALYGYYAQTNPAAKAYALASSGLTSNGTGGLGYNVYTVPEGQALIGTNGKLNPNATLGRKIIYNGQEYWLTPDDWIDEAYQSAFRQEYNVNISGATERSSFYASLGYLDNTGIIKSSALERYTARLKADYQAKKWLKVGGNMSYAHFSSSNGNSNEGSDSSTANIFAFSSQMPPIYPVYIRDGSGRIMVDDNGYQMYDYGDKGNAGLTRPLLPGANGLQTSWLNKKKAEGNAFSGSGFVDISLYKGLKLTVNGSTNIDETRTTYLNNQYYGQFAEAGGTISKYHTRDIAYNLQQILNYNETFGKHNVGLMVGHEYYQKKYYYLSGTKSKLFSYDNEELGGAVVDGAGAHSYIDDYNSEGYFMRAQYDYAGRYFVSGSYRRDASSRFHPDHRWGNFWSVGAAWLLNQENWFDAPWVNLLKLKASYGSQGNDNIGNSTIGYYLYTDTYSIENNNGEIAVLFGQKGNPNITWETNTNLNIGTEFGFWNNRLSGSVDFFNRKTSDMLFAFSVPSSLGYSSYYANVGDMVNRGVEVELNADLIQLFRRRRAAALHLLPAFLRRRRSRNGRFALVQGREGRRRQDHPDQDFGLHLRDPLPARQRDSFGIRRFLDLGFGLRRRFLDLVQLPDRRQGLRFGLRQLHVVALRNHRRHQLPQGHPQGVDARKQRLGHSPSAIRRSVYDQRLRPFPDRRELPEHLEHQRRLYAAVEDHPEIRRTETARLSGLRQRGLLVEASGTRPALFVHGSDQLLQLLADPHYFGRCNRTVLI